MNPEIKTIFDHVRGLTGVDERAAYLDETCAGEPAKRSEIEALLADTGRADAFFAGAETIGPACSMRRMPGENPGDIIGRYKLLQKIGEGGCGVVWMAEQSEPVRRRVALKVVRMGMDTQEFVARFEQERQALAMMEHPNIARVLDGGATPLGRPFFVMELVRGVPITKFCDDEKLPMAERLVLFVQVCQAIQHAHHKGIVHRDIKPTNILVAPGDDGKPVARVIDFGVAKAMDRTLTDRTLFTQFEQMVGTPAYMSPEQAGMGPMDIDTRSDIYSLGVLLYEILTGRPPFDPGELMRAGVEEMRRVIREDEPPKPSTRLRTLLGPALTGLAQSRHTEAPKLLSSMKGDLDWIVMKALEKSRSRRYETASNFAADIERYLRQEPVWARPPSFWYRAGKFARKHKGAVAAAAAVLMALLAGVAGFAWQAHRIGIERDKAVAARNQSETVAAVAASLIESPYPSVSGFLTNAAEKIDKGLSTQPEVRVTLLAALGETCHTLGSCREAISVQQKVLDYLTDKYTLRDRRTLAAKGALAWSIYDSSSFRKTEAIKMQQEVLDLSKEVLGEKDRDTVSAAAHLAVSLYYFGDQRKGREMMQQLYPQSQTWLEQPAPETLYIMHWLAVMLADNGQEAEAAALNRDLLPLSKQVNGSNHPHTIRAMSAVADFLSSGKTDAAGRAEVLETRKQVFAMSKEILGKEHPYTLATMVKLAGAYRRNRMSEEEYALLNETYALMLKVNGVNHTDTLWCMTDLANCKEGRILKNKSSENEALRKDVLAMRLEIAQACIDLPELGPAHPSTLGRITMLADSLAADGSLDEAVKRLKGVVDLIDQDPAKYVSLDRKWIAGKLTKYSEQASGRTISK